MRNFVPVDFEGFGQYLLRMSAREIQCRHNNEVFEGYSNTGYLSTIIYKVGFIVDNFKLSNNANYIITLVSISDGHTYISNYTVKEPSTNNYNKVIWDSKQLFCDWLNNPDLCSEFRFATQEELVKVIMYQSTKWRNR